MPGLHVYHQLPELVQTHVHWVGIILEDKANKNCVGAKISLER